MSYNLRTTSLVGEHLDTQLLKHGAKTFGTTQRKQERLNRFIEAGRLDNEDREILKAVIQVEQHKMQTRQRSRVLELLAGYLGY
jgi:hypothetical protein